MSKNNLFSNLMEKSMKLFYDAKKKSIEMLKENRNSEVRDCWKDVIDLTRTATIVSNYEEFNLESAEKSAVVITGLSCTGKTTIARMLSEKYPNYETIIFDKLGAELLNNNMLKYMINDMATLDDDMVVRMGEELEKVAKKKKNIIIEGEYCPLNVRSVLYKTLRVMGYKKIFLITTFNIPYEVMMICTNNRALLYNYTDKLELEESLAFKLRSFDEDVMPIIEKNMNVSKVMKTENFLKQVHDIEACRKEEFLTDMILIQREYGLMHAGADFATEWF